MSTPAKKAILKALISGAITELMVKTNSESVYVDDSTTLADKLASILLDLSGKAASAHVHAQSEITGLSAALSERPTISAMNTAISNAITELINGAPETYDTLKELADFVAEHADIEQALNSAIGQKADKTTVEALSATVSALGSLASKSQVSESDLDDALKEKVNAASEGNHSHNNKTVLDGITADNVSAWSAKSKIYIASTQPASLTSNDLFMQIVE